MGLWMNGDNILLEDLLMRTMIAVKEGKVPSYFMPDESEEMDVNADGVCDKIKEILEDINKFLEELPVDDVAQFMGDVAKLFNDLCDPPKEEEEPEPPKKPKKGKKPKKPKKPKKEPEPE